MAKISLALVAGALFASLTTATLINEEHYQLQNINFADENSMRYWMGCLRGFSDGFSRGLYNNDSEVVSKQCLGEATYKDFALMNQWILSGDVLKIFKSIGKFY